MGEPPLLAGGVKVTLANPLPPVAARPVGAPGSVAGVTRLVAADSTPLPMAVVAWTVEVESGPFDNPVTVQGLEAHVAVTAPGEEVTVYEVIGEPPLLPGAVNV